MIEPTDAPVFHQVDPGRLAFYRALATLVNTATVLGVITWLVAMAGWITGWTN